jgi:hypothetical protein
MRIKSLMARSVTVAEMLGNRYIFARVDGSWAEVHGDHLDHIEPKGREGLVFAAFCDDSEYPRATAAEQAAINRLVWTRV